jgi:hypothetical protein
MSTAKAIDVTVRIKQLQDAIELIKLGARGPVVAALTGLQGEDLFKVYENITGSRPPRGQLPADENWFTHRGPFNALHSAVFWAIYFKVLRATSDPCTGMISAYRIYQGRFVGDVRLTFDRAWCLTRLMAARTLTTVNCDCCGSAYVVHRFDLVDHAANCPMCRIDHSYLGRKLADRKAGAARIPRRAKVAVLGKATIDETESRLKTAPPRNIASAVGPEVAPRPSACGAGITWVIDLGSPT